MYSCDASPTFSFNVICSSSRVFLELTNVLNKAILNSFTVLAAHFEGKRLR